MLKEWLARIDPNAWYITLMYIVLIFAGAAVFTVLARMVMRRVMDHDIGDSSDMTRLRFTNNAISMVIWFVAIGLIIYTIPKFKAVAITMFAGAGILVAILGFAAQSAFANIISGIFIVMSRPFRVGDLIVIGTQYEGFVEDITLRHTVITDFQNRRIIIPNATVGNADIMNSTIEDPKMIVYVEISVSYDTDIEQAFDIVREEAMRHKWCIDNRTKAEIAEGIPAVVVRVVSMSNGALTLRAYVWVPEPSMSYVVRYELYHQIKKRFDAAGIQMPFPYRGLLQNQPNPPTPNHNKPA